MRTVQLTLDEKLVAEVDKVAAARHTTRSAFTREALRLALARLKEMDLEKRHRAGYTRKPAKKSEFDLWEKEQAWGKP